MSGCLQKDLECKASVLKHYLLIVTNVCVRERQKWHLFCRMTRLLQHSLLQYSTFSLPIKSPPLSSQSLSLSVHSQKSWMTDMPLMGVGGGLLEKTGFSVSLSRCNSPHVPCESALLTHPTHQPLLIHGYPPSHELDITNNETLQLGLERG